VLKSVHLLMLLGVVAGFGGHPLRGQEGRSQTREIASTTLRDVAVAIYDPHGSVIFYNPDLLQQFGAELTAFFFAHERGHIQLHHSRARLQQTAPELRDSLSQEWELAADCLAARSLESSNPGAITAAVDFFIRMGNQSYDREHPSGVRRAAWILACLSRLGADAP
jgi:hypothetical protein